MGSALISYEAEAGVATIVLADPPANAVTHEMMKDLDEAVLDARFDSDVEIILVTGYGDTFSTGVNVQMLSEIDPSFGYYFGLHASETLARLENTPKIVVAALNGPAHGLGLEIALSCDVRVAWEGAGTLWLPQASLGLMPSCGGTQRTARLLGRARTLEFVAADEPIDFAEGREIGLVDHVLASSSREEFLANVRGYATRLTSPRTAGRVMGYAKRSIVAGSDLPLDRALAVEREIAGRLWGSPDADEGIRASLEQRKPRFQGK